jgi:ATP-dependent Clp protease ATP-binding subunit ClpC
VKVELDQSAEDLLIKQGFSEDYGARPLRRAIERFVEDPLAEEILRIGPDVAATFKGTANKGGDPLLADGLEFSRVEIAPAPAKATVEAGAGD